MNLTFGIYKSNHTLSDNHYTVRIMARPPPTPLVDTIKEIQPLKNLIIDQVRAIHGHLYPTSHYTFSVLTNKEELLYSAQAIVYTKPDSFAEWKLLAVSGPVCNSTWEAVESLYCELQEQLGKMTDSLYEGGTWNGTEAINEPDSENADAD
ncbi:hypothetical protein CC77DRAFT_1067330 [Alternaria alternata]|uniref:Uncharacterized protein n=1 Tax=Alternaria alternata TaxID=5599 RepID=A0A177D321_ALTAL|nr:hypothetical protein CC77DRAFT_1067330 [Alternaria alternata]OAG14073.1 hypothetical protein CC77DRAFT_1067330 [Alternaria alternata]